MIVLKDAEGKEYKFETYNNLLVQDGVVTAINNRVESERTQHQKKYDDLDAKFKELNTQHDELKVKHMTDAEKAEHQEKERIRKENELTADRDKHKNLYKKFKIDSELLREISGFKTESGDEPFNHEQVSKLLKAEFDDIDLVNDTDVVFKKGAATFTAKEAVKTFLESEQNANLLKSGLGSGGGTRHNRNNQTPGKTIKRSDWEKLDPDAQMKVVTDKVQIVD